MITNYLKLVLLTWWQLKSVQSLSATDITMGERERAPGPEYGDQESSL